MRDVDDGQAELRVQLQDPGEEAGYVEKRAFREAFQAASKLLLAPVVGRKVALPDAPRPGFLAELYPDHADFALPVEGSDASGISWSPALPSGFPAPYRGTDVLTFRGAQPAPQARVTAQATTASDVTLDNGSGYASGDFALVVRPWLRFSEKTSKDDNPDITSYLGHGDLQAMWQVGEHGFGLTLRSTLLSGAEHRGSAQFDWSVPIHRNLKGYVQFFNGYGETLIDYNHRQTTFGVGVSLVDWL